MPKNENTIHPVLLQLAPNAMSTVGIVKAVKNIPAADTSYNVFLTLLINYASGWVERTAGRRFGLARYQETAKGDGLQELVLEQYPIRVIHSITDTESGTVVDPKAYSFSKNGHVGVAYRDSDWSRRGYPTGLVPDHVLSKEYLLVDYTAGYILPKDADETTKAEWLLPSDLQGIIWQIVSMELDLADNGADGLAAFSIADVSWTFDKAPRQSWLDIIATYKEGA